jgi:hypothetical protein
VGVNVCFAKERFCFGLSVSLKVAVEILNAAPGALHITAEKIKRIFSKQLRYIVDTGGKIGIKLYSMFKLLCHSWSADTQEIEGIHNLIRLAACCSTTMGLELVDARVGMRKEAGLGSRGAKNLSYTELEPRLKRILQDAVEHFDLAVVDVMARVHRFDPPKACRRPFDHTLAVEPVGAAGLALTWAVANNTVLRRYMLKNHAIADSGAVMEIKDILGRSAFWVVVLKYRFSSYMLKLARDHDSVHMLEVAWPPVLKLSVDVILEYYESCVNDSARYDISFSKLHWALGNFAVILDDTMDALEDDADPLSSLHMVLGKTIPKVPKSRASSHHLAIANLIDESTGAPIALCDVVRDGMDLACEDDQLEDDEDNCKYAEDDDIRCSLDLLKSAAPKVQEVVAEIEIDGDGAIDDIHVAFALRAKKTPKGRRVPDEVDPGRAPKRAFDYGFFADLDHRHLLDAYAQWTRAVESLLSRQAALQTKTLGENDELSLVRFSSVQAAASSSNAAGARHDRVVYVHFTDPASFMGRQARVDPISAEAKYMVGSTFPIVSWEGCEVIHPAVGARIVRSKVNREFVCDAVVNLKRMWQAVLGSLCESGSAMLGVPCCICKATRQLVHARADVVDVAEGPADAVLTCSFCLRSCHEACVENCVLPHMCELPPAPQEVLAVVQSDFGGDIVPRAFKDGAFVCLLCKHFFDVLQAPR